jgi:hypothetical protein
MPDIQKLPPRKKQINDFLNHPHQKFVEPVAIEIPAKKYIDKIQFGSV